MCELSQEIVVFHYKYPFQPPTIANTAKHCLHHLKGKFCNLHFEDTITRLLMLRRVKLIPCVASLRCQQNHSRNYLSSKGGKATGLNWPTFSLICATSELQHYIGYNGRKSFQITAPTRGISVTGYVTEAEPKIGCQPLKSENLKGWLREDCCLHSHVQLNFPTAVLAGEEKITSFTWCMCSLLYVKMNAYCVSARNIML